MQQLRTTTKSLTFPPLSIAMYSFIQPSLLGRQWRERKCPIFVTVAKGDSNPGSLDCESGILPLSCRTPPSSSRMWALMILHCSRSRANLARSKLISHSLPFFVCHPLCSWPSSSYFPFQSTFQYQPACYQSRLFKFFSLLLELCNLRCLSAFLFCFLSRIFSSSSDMPTF